MRTVPLQSKRSLCETSTIITILIVFLCCLASYDLFIQYIRASDEYWESYYKGAVWSSNDLWQMAYRIEDLQLRTDKTNEKIAHTWDIIRSAPNVVLDAEPRHNALFLRSRITHTGELSQEYIEAVKESTLAKRSFNFDLSTLTVNISNVFNLHCGNTRGPPIRIGLNDFRTDAETACHLFNSPVGNSKDRLTNPHFMFEKVDLGEGSFGLRSISSNQFLQAIPPTQVETDVEGSAADTIGDALGSDSLEWELSVGNPTPGIFERLRLTEDGQLYSSALGGFFQCSDDRFVHGYAGKYGAYNSFALNPVSPSNYLKAKELVDLSRQLLEVQTYYVSHHQEQRAVDIKQTRIAEQRTAAQGLDSPANRLRIAMVIPVISKGTVMQSISDSPLWPNFFDSFMKSIDWRSNKKYCFSIYVGFDKADDIYDTGDAWNEMREEFRSRAAYRMKTDALMTDEMVSKVFSEGHLSLKLMHFDDLHGAPSQVVSQLALQAYADGCDYFYQVNDDTLIITPNWAPAMIEALSNNLLVANFGVTGPLDMTNDRIFTHAFVHRTHIDIFGYYFPPYFKNWWSDDWISTVYGSEHSFRLKNILIKHNVEAQKEYGFTRYDVDKSAKFHLDRELRLGHIEIDRWLRKKSLPRLPLPNICGYIPLSKYLLEPLRNISQTDHHQHIVRQLK